MDRGPPTQSSPSQMSASTNSKRGSRERDSRFARAPVMKLSTPTTRRPSATSRSQRWLPRNPAAPRTAARDSAMGPPLLLSREVVERELAGQGRAVLLQHQVDALPDVLGHRHPRPLVQQLETLALLRRDVHGGGDLLSPHPTG